MCQELPQTHQSGFLCKAAEKTNISYTAGLSLLANISFIFQTNYISCTHIDSINNIINVIIIY